ncbi:MAG: DUF1631 domain-containing protein [Lysobacteraceae bacterium]
MTQAMTNDGTANIVDFAARGNRMSQSAPLLDSIRAQALATLPRILAAVFDNADDTLFDLLNNVPAEDHQEYMDAMRELRLRRKGSEAKFRGHFEQVFQSLASGKALNADEVNQSISSGFGELSLVTEDELEEQLGENKIAQAIMRDFGPALTQLDQRIAVVASNTKLDENSNPIGSAHIAKAFGTALAECDIAVSVKMILFKLFEREALDELEDLYGGINKQLISAGILPEIKLVPTRSPDAPKRKAKARKESDDDASDAGSSGSGGGGGLSPDEHALFSSLHKLLQSYRSESQQPSVSDTGDGQRRAMSSEEVLTVLGLFQNDTPPGLSGAINDPSQSLAQRLKQELLSGAGKLGIDPEQSAMSAVDEDAVDLVGMLFEVLLDERDLDGDMRGTIGRLVVPFIKVAMLDRRMFLQRSHPARRLLNSLAEACEGNKGETPQERSLQEKVNNVVDRLTKEFNENIAIFETLEQEFKAFIEQHRKRVELAEKRAAEAQRGRERLEHARNIANAEIAVRVANHNVPPTMKSVMDRYWAHHLTVTALRQGHDSAEYREAVSTGESVLKSLTAALSGESALLPTLAPMRQALEKMLASSGCVGDAAKDVIRAVAEELRRMIRGESTDRVDEVVAATEPPQVAAPAPQTPDPNDVKLGLSADPEDLDFDAADVETLRTMPVGTWVEIKDENGESQPAKLSWVSPISSRLLFVNRRGMRCCVASPEELAAMMREGRFVVRDSSSAFEYAMNQVLGKLRADGLSGEQFAT